MAPVVAKLALVKELSRGGGLIALKRQEISTMWMKRRWRRIGGAVLMVVTVFPLLAQAQGEEDLIIVTRGMSCAGCSGGLSDQLMQLKGVKAVESDWQSNTTRVILEESSSLSLSEIQQAVEQVMGGMLSLVDVKFAKRSSGKTEE